MLDICCLKQLGRPASSNPPQAMINKIFSNSAKKPAGSAGRGVAGLRRGAWLGWKGRGCICFFFLFFFFPPFLSAQVNRSSSRLWETKWATRRKTLLSKKQVIQLLDLKALQGKKWGDLSVLLLSFFSPPNTQTEKLCKLSQHQQDKDAPQSFPGLFTLAVVQGCAAEICLSLLFFAVSWIIFRQFSMGSSKKKHFASAL